MNTETMTKGILDSIKKLEKKGLDLSKPLELEFHVTAPSEYEVESFAAVIMERYSDIGFSSSQ